MGARILSVIDAFDAMTSGRVYQKRQSYEAVLNEIESFSGTQFDPMVVEAFRNVPEEDWEILRARSLSDRQDNQSFRAIVFKLVYAERSLELVH
jgi:HD-GYP domain-containing protein (c-di-GMP phosphodiesterase class II)